VLLAGCAAPVDLAQFARQQQDDRLCIVNCVLTAGDAPCGQRCLDAQLRRLHGDD
jgi:hypothetical protein